MKFNFFRVFLILFLLSPTTAYAAKKKDSLNQDVELMNSQDIAALGEWKLYMDKCGGKEHTNFIKELARLSWPDFKNYMASAGQFTSGGWTTGGCKQEDTKMLLDYYDWIISELTYLTGSSSDDNENYSDDIIGDVDDIDGVEAKLVKLKDLYDKDLITLDEYEEKRKEILDSF